MKVKTERVIIKKEKQTIIRFYFFPSEEELEREREREIFSNNTSLKHRTVYRRGDFCSFYIPFIMDKPHIDILAYVALKIISPMIIDTFEMEGAGISKKFSESIKKWYTNIKHINVDEMVKPLDYTKRKNTAIAFSGGADSMAVAKICDQKYPLIMHAEVEHDLIKISNNDNNDTHQVLTMSTMKNKNKYIIFTDFMSLFTNKEQTKKIPPDGFPVFLSSVLVSEHLDIRNLWNGITESALCSREQLLYNNCKYDRRREFIKNAGIYLDFPISGVSEVVTSRILYSNHSLNSAFSCTLMSKDGNPCLKCKKCFRKTLLKMALISAHINNNEPKSKKKFEQLTKQINKIEEEINSFENIVNKWMTSKDERNFKLLPIIKWSFESLWQYQFNDNIRNFRDFVCGSNLDVSFLDKINPEEYVSRQPEIMEFLKKVEKYSSYMDSSELENYKKINYKENYKKLNFKEDLK